MNIRLEEGDFIGNVEGARHVGSAAAGEIFVDDSSGLIVICYLGRCLVID